jgi:hypothetical protein
MTCASSRAVLIAALAIAGASSAARGPAVQSSFLYSLDDGSARRTLGWAALNWDATASELLVVSGGVVDIFNDNGLISFSFEENAFGTPIDVVAMEDGDLYVLAAHEGRSRLVRCNYRGEPAGIVELTGLAAEFADGFNPGNLVVRGGRIYLADRNSMKVAVIDAAGAATASYDLGAIIGLGPRDRTEAMMRGFAVDAKGNLLFTVASVFSAFVVTPEGKSRSFGSRGSSPGKFNIATGIASDDDGHLFITDSLRSVVMVFDSSTLRFLGEFGYRGDDPENLISPSNVVVGNGRVYVSQSRGAVKAFAVRFD